MKYRHGWRRGQWVMGLWIGLLLFAVAASSAPNRNQASYWRLHYGEAPPTDACVQKVGAIFKRVTQAAGLRPGDVPPVLVTRDDPQWSPRLAMALPDGSIVLSKGVPTRLLGSCDRASSAGEAQLAFILGHELAHQRREQFWHYHLFNALKNSPHAPPRRVPKEVQWNQELQADSDAIVYAAMAGYPTHAIVTDDRSNSFFEQWIESQSKTHPTPQLRAEVVRARLHRVLSQVDVFEIGMRFYQSGKYDEAIRAFSAFRREFDSYEVNLNLAVSHHQRSLQIYCQWQHTPLLPFHVSLMVEPLTLAAQIQLDQQYFSRGGTSPAERVRYDLDRAIDYYETAIARAPAQAVAYSNLGAALIARSQLHLQSDSKRQTLADLYAAMSTLQSAPAASLAARNTLAVAAYYLDGEQRAQRAWQELKTQYPPAAHNLRLLDKPDKVSCKPTGKASRQAPKRDEHVGELAVGMYADDLSAQWGAPQERRVVLEQDAFTMAQYPNAIETVAQDRIIHMIHVQPSYRGTTALGIKIGDPQDAVHTRYGPPTRVLPTRSGQTWGYDTVGIAFHLRQGAVISWLVYE